MSPVLIVTMLAMLLGTQPITTDLYLPALPGLATELGSPMTRTQLTLSALLFAFGISQLFLGPVADRFAGTNNRTSAATAATWNATLAASAHGGQRGGRGS